MNDDYTKIGRVTISVEAGHVSITKEDLRLLYNGYPEFAKAYDTEQDYLSKKDRFRLSSAEWEHRVDLHIRVMQILLIKLLQCKLIELGKNYTKEGAKDLLRLAEEVAFGARRWSDVKDVAMLVIEQLKGILEEAPKKLDPPTPLPVLTPEQVAEWQEYARGLRAS